MAKNKLTLRSRIGETEGSSLTTNASISHLSDHVRFSFRDCDVKSYCVRKLSDVEIGQFYSRLGYFEQLTWQQVCQMPREKGFTIEQKGASNHQMMVRLFPDFGTFLHFRVNGTPQPFRVFGARYEDLCYVLLVDREGGINH